MKILFDHQIYSLQNYGGISRYFSELYYQINQMRDVQVRVSAFVHNNEYLHAGFKTNLVPNKVRYGVNEVFSSLEIALDKFDILHPTYYDPYFLTLNKKPFVLTIQDMIHEKFPTFFPNDKNRDRKRKLIREAAHLIAISENTKNDLLSFYSVPEEKITVIYDAASLTLTPSSIQSPNWLPKNFLLYVGHRRAYKNFLFAVKAVAALLRQENITFVCIGGGSFSVDEHLTFEKLNISHLMRQASVSDEVLSMLYTKAIALIYPSLYEGFGLSILDAYVNKCPVICSRTSSLIEVAGRAALLFDPQDSSDLLGQVRKLIGDSKLRNRLISMGVKQNSHFSWKATCQQTVAVYEQI